MEKTEFTPLIDILEKIHPLPEMEKNHFLSLLHSNLLEKGDFFIRAGQNAFQIGFLVSGLIRYYHIDDQGKEFIKHFCFDGHFVASYSSLQTGKPSNYFIEALEETQLIVFSFQDWMGLLSRHPVWGILNDRIQAEALISAEKRERSLITDDAMTRYLNLLEEVPGIESRLRQYDLAKYLGITPIALSRIRKIIIQK